ncbi:NAD(P)H-dependent oxidoreductase [Paucibacter sp. R3-3]|uniref:FMN dependent NADH:quinone oxidoreductase n=1 Tax=Roseateles agri TaxID=3098619 RepID=A0ABU5DD76_9BURK|nr:NAD(P)H-dependent oxidoreductase [Paucibacter sp. R3-3]MDY0744084.1 NAD(P)H-dependent oxidoreductase [Paucibacter sp. R3-3]
MNILQLNSSARRVQDGQGSYSSRLATELVEGLKKTADAKGALTVRDLGLDPHPAMDEAALGALFTPADKRSAEQAERVAANDALIAELFAHDAIVIATPMINFGVPTQLKNWIDAVARAGTTFSYGATGPVGLVTGKKVYVVVATGGVHRNQATDGITPYLRTVLGFLGMTNIEFIYAEGLAMGPEAEAAGVAGARAQIAELIGAVAA